MYSNDEYTDMILTFGQAYQNSGEAARQYANQWPHRRQPERHIFQRIEMRLRERGTFELNRRNGVPGIARRNRDEDIVLQAVVEDPTISLRRIYDVKRSTSQRISKQNHFHAYHYTRVQDLRPQDFEARIHFCEWILLMSEGDEEFCQKILWTDESMFNRDGIFNIHNNHQWDNENPHVTVVRSNQERFSLNIWGGLIGGNVMIFNLPDRVDGPIYAQFLENDLQQLLENTPLRLRQEMIFQHDGAPPHFSIVARQILTRSYPNNWIGRGGPIPWPPRSPDLTPLDFFMWGHIKDYVYKTRVENLEDLQQRINEAVQTVTPQMIRSATQNVIRRAQLCLNQNGGHFEQFL